MYIITLTLSIQSALRDKKRRRRETECVHTSDMQLLKNERNAFKMMKKTSKRKWELCIH